MNIVLKHIVLYRKQEEAIKAEQEKTLLMQAKPQVTKFLKSKLYIIISEILVFQLLARDSS